MSLSEQLRTVVKGSERIASMDELETPLAVPCAAAFHLLTAPAAELTQPNLETTHATV